MTKDNQRSSGLQKKNTMLVEQSVKKGKDYDPLAHANSLYNKVLEKYGSGENLNVNQARLIIEQADDAIREFGNTNQEKKVQLRAIKAEAQKILPPNTIDDLRKRAEGQLLEKSYPKGRRGRLLLITSVLSILAGITAFGLYSALKKEATPKQETAAAAARDAGKTEAEPASTPLNSQMNELEKQAAMRQQKDDVTKLRIESAISQILGEDASVVIYTSGYGTIEDKNVEVFVNQKNVSQYIKSQVDASNASVVTVMGSKAQLNLNDVKNEVILRIGSYSTNTHTFKTFKVY